MSDDGIQVVTMDQISKRGRGRPPKHGEAMTGAERQLLYAKARSRDMAEVAYALKDALARTKANQKAFSDYTRAPSPGTGCGAASPACWRMIRRRWHSSMT
jgi:hypothetical protein